jgi:RHS repeat-associated protein
MGSQSYTYAVPLFNLPGRHGLNLNLSLIYNSVLWDNLGGGVVAPDPDSGTPSIGFHLDFGTLIWYTTQGVLVSGILIDHDGTKHVLAPAPGTSVGNSTQWVSIDSTYITVQHTYQTSSGTPPSDVVTYKNGVQVSYQFETTNPLGSATFMQPFKIEDTTGNFISISYTGTYISTVTDTVGRVISFIYTTLAPGFLQLNCVTDGASCGASGSHTYTFNWNSNYILSYNFHAVTGGIGSIIPPLQGSQFPYTVLSSVTRPDGTKVQFNYGDWFIVDDIQELSNNGTLRYETSYNFPAASAGTLSTPPSYTQQTVTTFDKDGKKVQAVWNYQWVFTSTAITPNLLSCAAIIDPLNTSRMTTFSTNGDAFDGLVLQQTTGTGSTTPCTTAPTTTWMTVKNDWTTDTDGSGNFTGINPRIQSVTNILSDGTTQSQVQVVSYDSHGNATDVQEFDYGKGTQGGLLRETVRSFASQGNIFTLPADVQVKDGSGKLLAHAQFTYDDYSKTALQNQTPLPPGFDSSNPAFAATSSTQRGNLTGMTIYANAAQGTGAINANFSYDIFGNRLQSQYGCCTFSSTSYSADTEYAYPDSTSAGPSGNQLTTSFTYDMSSGQILTTVNPNLQKTQFSYDIDHRPAKVITPDNNTVSSSYDDSSAIRGITVSNTANSLVTKAISDLLGRPLVSEILNGTTLVSETTTISDSLGRPVQVSNPFGPNDSVQYVSQSYDPLGRTISVTPPSLAGTTQKPYTYQYSPTTFTDAAGTSHSGLSSQSIDPAGKPRVGYTDALGRLVRVDEPGPGGSPGADASTSGSISGNEQTVVTQVTDFSFSVAPNSQFVAQGSSTSFTVSITPPSGYTSAINLSASGLPAGATASFNPPSVSGSGSSTLTITAGGTTPTGNYNVTVTGSNDVYNATAQVNLTVNINPAVLMAIINNILLADSATNTTSSAITSSAQAAPAAKGKSSPVAPPAKLAQTPPAAPPAATKPQAARAGSTADSSQSSTVNKTTFDTGSVWVTVNGFKATAPYGEGSTAGSVAAGLASQFNAPNSGSPVSAFANGANLNLFANVRGSSGNYTVTQGSSSDQPGTFTQPSFAVSISGLTGGVDPQLGSPANSTFYSYDALGHLLQITQGAQTRTYTYDSLGRALSGTAPETNNQGGSVTYTDTGVPSVAVSPRNIPGTNTKITATFAYDTLNRLSSVTYNDGTPGVTLTYNPPGAANNTGGRLAQVTNGVAGESYQYDVMGRLTLSAKTIGGQTYNIKYAYNTDGTPSSITYPSGRVVAFSEDAIGRVTNIQNNGSTLLSIGSYNAAGDILQETYGNGITGTYSYNNQQQLAGLQYGNSASTLVSTAYNYGGAQDNGQIQSILDNVDSGRSASYVYDSLGRLQQAATFGSANYPKWDLAFGYDRYNNRLSETPQPDTSPNVPVPSNQVSVNPATNQINTAGYSYDASGNMTGDGLFSYGYNALNQITSVSPPGASTPIATYSYDAHGMRVVKNSTTSTVYIYMSGKPIAEYAYGAPASSPNTEYVYRGGAQLATAAAGVLTYHYRDHLSGRVDTDAGGNTVRTYAHFPFGETWYETGAPSKWKFTTYENDPESGLNYAGARYHSPRLGRFMSLDPAPGQLGDPQGFNRYSYVRNDPVNLTDPTGMFLCGDCDEGDDDDDDSGGGQLPDAPTPQGPCDAACQFPNMSPEFLPFFQDISVTINVSMTFNALDSLGSSLLSIPQIDSTVVTMSTGDPYDDYLQNFRNNFPGQEALTRDAYTFIYGQGDLWRQSAITGNVIGGITVSFVQLGLGGLGGAAAEIGSSAEIGAEAAAEGAASGAGVPGPWVAEATNVRAGGTIVQSLPGSCVSACGQILTDGAVSEAQLLGRLGEWADPMRLAKTLNSMEGAGTWQATYFASGEEAVSIAQNGKMAATLLRYGMKIGHTVVLGPGEGGSFVVLDPAIGSSYNVTAEWITKWVSSGVF